MDGPLPRVWLEQAYVNPSRRGEGSRQRNQDCLQRVTMTNLQSYLYSHHFYIYFCKPHCATQRGLWMKPEWSILIDRMFTTQANKDIKIKIKIDIKPFPIKIQHCCFNLLCNSQYRHWTGGTLDMRLVWLVVFTTPTCDYMHTGFSATTLLEQV